MKIRILFSAVSENTNEEKNFELLVDWECLFLPRENELFDLMDFISDEMQEEYGYHIYGKSWSVLYVNWSKKNGIIIPDIYLEGE